MLIYDFSHRLISINTILRKKEIITREQTKIKLIFFCLPEGQKTFNKTGIARKWNNYKLD